VKNKKAVIGIIIAVVAVAVAVTLAIIYKNELMEIVNVVKEKINEKKRVYFAREEFDDYADVE